MQFARLPGSPAPKANVQLIGRQRTPPARQTAGGVALSRQRFERNGTLRLSSPAKSVAAIPALGAHFAVIQEDAFLEIDASHPARLDIVRRWSAPGLRGVVPVHRSALVFGDAGAFWLERFDAATKPDLLQRAAVTDASARRGLCCPCDRRLCPDLECLRCPACRSLGGLLARALSWPSTDSS